MSHRMERNAYVFRKKRLRRGRDSNPFTVVSPTLEFVAKDDDYWLK